LRSRRLLIALSASAVLASACSATPTDAVAVVNGQELSARQFEAVIRAAALEAGSFDADGGLPAAQLAETQRERLSFLVAVTLIDQEASLRGIAVTADQVQEQYDFEVINAGGEAELADQLAVAGLTADELREQIRVRLLLDTLRADVVDAIEIGEDQVRGLYDSRADQWETATVSHILVEDLDRAQELRDLIDAGEATLEELAESDSIDTFSAATGGSLGDYARGSFVQPFEDTVWAATVGVLYGPVETEFGFHLIRVDAFTTTAYDEVRDRLADELRGSQGDQAWAAVLETLFTAADVTVDGRIGVWDPVSGAVVEDA